jgi:hypothetical protein
MTELQAKPIIENKFWIVEQDGVKYATLRKNDDKRFVLSNADGVKIFESKKNILQEFGNDFFITKNFKDVSESKPGEIHGYPVSCKPYNVLFDIQRKLPLFTKNVNSKCLYCAGYYVIKYDKNWAKSFCPKLITLQRYEYQGPFKTEFEMKQVLSNVSK